MNLPRPGNFGAGHFTNGLGAGRITQVALAAAALFSLFSRIIVSDAQANKDQKAQNPAESAAGIGLSDPAAEQIASYRDQFYIHPAKRIKQFDQGPVKAYAASGLTDVSNATHYALVCEPNLTPRTRAAAAFSRFINASLTKLVACGPVYWPPARAERYVLIYELFAGQPLMPEGQFKGLDLKPELVQDALIRPLVNALLDMRDADVVHGNIRPSNIFVTGVGAGFDRVMLGECLATPPSYCQPAFLETIERAMADPIGRGLPTLDSDIYSLGATLAVLLRSRDPMEGMSTEEMIRYKVDQGSYIALTGKDRFTGAILELLRGCLQDDRSQRWTLEDIINWMEGQRLSPKPPSKKIKAARPIHFQDERYFRPALLAMDLNKNQSEAAQVIENGHLAQWVERSLEDSSIMTRLEAAMETVAEQGRGPGYWDRLISRVSIALDPEAPIRYKGMILAPEGISYALTDAMIRRADLQPFLDLINQQVVMFWLTAQVETQVDVGSLVSRYDTCRAILKQQNIAYGIERCLYYLNPECPCLSDKIKGFYVQTPEDLMIALEKVAAQPGRPELMLDRHSIAFISVKDRKDVDPFLMELNAPELYKRILGNIKTLATIQQRSRLEKFPGICRWSAQILDPVYERIHDRELRKSMKDKIVQLAESGDIGKIAGIIDNPATTQKDTENYNQARNDYYQLRVENAKLEDKLADPAQFRQGIGREVAALVSCIISGVTILFFVFIFFTKGSIF